MRRWCSKATTGARWEAIDTALVKADEEFDLSAVQADVRALLLNRLAGVYQLSAGSDFEVVGDQRDERGHRYVRLQQLQGGLRLRIRLRQDRDRCLLQDRVARQVGRFCGKVGVLNAAA